MAIRWDFNDDHMGKVIIEQQFEDTPSVRWKLKLNRKKKRLSLHPCTMKLT